MVLVVIGVIGVPTIGDWLGVFAMLCALSLGTMFIVSAAYVFWGRLLVARDMDGWCSITWFLGRRSRSVRFPTRFLRSVEIEDGGPSLELPSSEGPRLRLELVWPRRIVYVGGGFYLDRSSLAAIEEIVRMQE